jgi:hypothetical protein
MSLSPLAIDNIFYFSDRAPEGIASVLEGAFPQANKVSDNPILCATLYNVAMASLAPLSIYSSRLLRQPMQ